MATAHKNPAVWRFKPAMSSTIATLHYYLNHKAKDLVNVYCNICVVIQNKIVWQNVPQSCQAASLF